MANAIRVVLEQDVDHLGTSGDVVRVRPGYARNFLIPRRLAVAATPQNLARVEQLRHQASTRAEHDLSRARELKVALEADPIRILRAVGEENKMYGSVTAKDIEEAFKAQRSLEIDRKRLELREPIKQLGLHQVSIKLHREVHAVLRVEVIKASST